MAWWRNIRDDVIKWKHFPRYWSFVRGIHRSPVNSPHKGQWRGALMFSSICAWTNGWVNNRDAGDLRVRRAHYDVTAIPASAPKCLIGIFLREADWLGVNISIFKHKETSYTVCSNIIVILAKTRPGCRLNIKTPQGISKIYNTVSWPSLFIMEGLSWKDGISIETGPNITKQNGFQVLLTVPHYWSLVGKIWSLNGAVRFWLCI